MSDDLAFGTWFTSIMSAVSPPSRRSAPRSASASGRRSRSCGSATTFRPKLQKCFGPFPKRTPLNAHVTRRISTPTTPSRR